MSKVVFSVVEDSNPTKRVALVTKYFLSFATKKIMTQNP
jgi:hypothetical protein